MKTLKQLENARYSAERRANDWYYKYETELEWLCVRDGKGNMVSLKSFYSHLPFTADLIESHHATVYEEDMDADKDGVYKVCTRRAVKRLRHIEQKINEWEEKMRCLDYLIDMVYDDGTPCVYCENEYKELVGDLAALGISI